MPFIAWITIILFRASLNAAYRDGDARLVNSNFYGEGRVEVFYQGSWGTICQNGWELVDAEVICRQLGFTNGAQKAIRQAKFGEGTGMVLLSNVNCQGDEANLLECSNVIDTWGLNDCSHGGDVGVRCNAPNYKGCFPLGQALADQGLVGTDDMTFERCYQFCSQSYKYFWMHNGHSCGCANILKSQASSSFAQCILPCAGDNDWICGGEDFAAVYEAQVELPYVAFNGFPGRFNQDTISTFTGTFVPKGNPDYIFIRVHQFDLPSTSPDTFLTDMFPNIEKGSGNYWIYIGSNSLYISHEDIQIGVNGLLLEFGGGYFCPQPSFISNGQYSTQSFPPFTVGNQFDVDCNSRYTPFDGSVFCRVDGNISRPIRCDAEYVSPTISPVPDTQSLTPTQPTSQPSNMMSSTRAVVITLPPDKPGIITAFGQCVVPVVENGKVNGTAIREVVPAGSVLGVSCNPIFEAVETTATCQRNGTFIPAPECRRNPTTFIILIVVASVAAVFLMILFILLVVCALYFTSKRNRKVRHNQTRSGHDSDVEISSPYGRPPPIETVDDSDDIIVLPDDDLPSSEDDVSLNEERPVPERKPDTETGEIGVEEATVLQGLNDVVQDMERQTLSGQVVRPTLAASEGFGGHFARN